MSIRPYTWGFGIFDSISAKLFGLLRVISEKTVCCIWPTLSDFILSKMKLILRPIKH